MKRIVLSLLLMVSYSCNKESIFDCFQSAGANIQEEVFVEAFTRILVNRDVELILVQGNQQTVTIETGENLINDVEVKVVDGQLILSDYNNCNLVRDYGITKITVRSPNLTEIRTSTQYDISSDGVLSYDDLTLISEDFNYPDSYTVGDFRLQLNSQNLEIQANNLSFFYLNGTVTNLFVAFYAGAGRFEGENLIAENVRVYHRGSNDMIVNPQLTLTGDLLGTGDLISVNQPNEVNINQIYTGQLIFR